MRTTRNRGVTLIELCFALAVVAVLASLAAPGFRSALRESAVRSAAYDLMAGLQQTRGSSILEGRAGVLCLTDAAGFCRASPAGAWRAYLVPSAIPGGISATDAGTRALPLAERALPAGVELRANRPRLTFWPTALAADTGTLTICDSAGVARPRAIVISHNGRARMAPAAAEACRT